MNTNPESSVEDLEHNLLELKKEMQKLRGILDQNFAIIHQIKATRMKAGAPLTCISEQAEEAGR